MTIREVVSDVRRGEIVMLDYWVWVAPNGERLDKRGPMEKYWKLLDSIEVNHPEIQIDRDDEANVVWLYSKGRS